MFCPGAGRIHRRCAVFSADAVLRAALSTHSASSQAKLRVTCGQNTDGSERNQSDKGVEIHDSHCSQGEDEEEDATAVAVVVADHCLRHLLSVLCHGGVPHHSSQHRVR